MSIFSFVAIKLTPFLIRSKMNYCLEGVELYEIFDPYGDLLDMTAISSNRFVPSIMMNKQRYPIALGCSQN